MVGEAARSEASTQPLAAEDLIVDAVVEIEDVGLGTVVEIPKGALDAKSLITVQVGDLRTRVARSRLKKPARDRVQNFQAIRQASTSGAAAQKWTNLRGGQRARFGVAYLRCTRQKCRRCPAPGGSFAQRTYAR